ncbi:MAG TPA: ATP synthase F1 subunit delta [Saprospiraceae bacterium]|nr:ATP synthase F1 subunit delta [Saprospiraceae bacterium]HMP22576.1 ATP synthase F1 subunit delta [Saprospiraceae bacterium]
MSVAKIAHRYAQSLLELALEQNKLERILEDVQSFQAAAKNRDFYLFIKSPIIPGAKKQTVVEQLFRGKYDELTMLFLGILIRKSREMYLPEIASEFIQEYKKHKHITTVRLTAAAPVGEATVEALRKHLMSIMHVEETLEIGVNVDPELIGGFVLEFDNKVYDASVKDKLSQLKKEFADNLYISQIIAR